MIDISKVKDDKETILRLRRIWWGMKTRCYNKNDREYKYYGQRGIVISDEWHIFENFKNWSLNNGYDNNLTIDRIDVNGNYCPENCRWADIFTQNNNKRTNIILEYKGELYTLAQLADLANIPYTTFKERINEWKDVEKAVEEPYTHNKKSVDQYDLHGNFIKRWNGIVDAEKSLGIYRKSIYNCYSGRNKTAGGFVWRRVISDDIVYKIDVDTKNSIPTQIEQYDTSNNYIKTWKSAASAGRELNINSSGIISCCRGKLKTSGGYIWKYADEDKNGAYGMKDVLANM